VYRFALQVCYLDRSERTYRMAHLRRRYAILFASRYRCPIADLRRQWLGAQILIPACEKGTDFEMLIRMRIGVIASMQRALWAGPAL
jgi:hypothetical protein